MSNGELTALAEALADVAKEKGLKRIRAGGVEIERWPERDEAPVTVPEDHGAEDLAKLRDLQDDWAHSGAMPKGTTQ